ncbi:MAG: HlyD family secretion protein [Desulfovibrionales bacterium]
MRVPQFFRNLRLIVPVAFLVLAAALAYVLFWGEEELPSGLVQVNGRMEGDVATVGSKYEGRVEEIRIREGTRVEKGEILLVLESDRTRAQVRQAEHQLESLSERLKALQTELSILEADVPLNIERTRDAVEQARARVQETRERQEQASRDASRFARLYEEETVARREAEEASLQLQVTESELAVARKALEQAEKELEQAALGRKRIQARKEELAAARSDVERARAGLDEITTVLNDLTIRAPVTGTVTSRLVEEGETVSPGGALFEVVNLKTLYLKAYVPETDIGKIAHGHPARIHVDAFPDRVFPATVGFIASEAQFTPKDVQTPEERTKLVYEVRLYLDENPGGRLTPGLPADAVIKWEEGAQWAEPVW